MFAVLICQAFSVVFALSVDEIYPVCAAILGVVGLMVLFQVCKPFNRFRMLIWAVMLGSLAAVFLLLGEFIELGAGSDATRLLMLTLLLMTPTVFFAIQRIFDLWDRGIAWICGLFHRRKKDPPSEK